MIKKLMCLGMAAALALGGWFTIDLKMEYDRAIVDLDNEKEAHAKTKKGLAKQKAVSAQKCMAKRAATMLPVVGTVVGAGFWALEGWEVHSATKEIGLSNLVSNDEPTENELNMVNDAEDEGLKAWTLSKLEKLGWRSKEN